MGVVAINFIEVGSLLFEVTKNFKVGVVAINFIEVGSLLFEVTKNFKLFQK